MRLYPLALTAALLPILTIHLSYLLAASMEQVPWCLPYWHSCTSISATGRLPPSYHLFKALMIPAAVLLAAFWWLSVCWLQALGCRAQRAQRWIVGLGLVSAAGLLLYSVMLGAIGDVYQLQRRIGVISFFGCCYLAQLLITWRLWALPEVVRHYQRALQDLRTVSLVILVVGLLSVLLSAALPTLYQRTDNAFEWTFTLLLCLHALLVSQLWRRSGFRTQLRVTL